MKNTIPQALEAKTESTYYVGIGASAGGLEAIVSFFKAMPEDTGMVFIVIQHLSPDYKSLMNELLARHTRMPIEIAQDGVEAQPNTIYLIPPRKNLLIFHGKFYLEEQKSRGLNLPIDIFFRSLAADKNKYAIGIILSGTGSDGTMGIRAIKEAGGMVMVQDDQSAKFDGMPRSSISTGLVDYILPPEKMPEELLNYIKHPFIKKSATLDNIMSKNIDTLTKIILMLRDHTGIDFSFYKENTIIRRLERRVSINRFNTLEEYMVFLSESNKEKDILYRELLIGVTRFFRDQEVFSSINEKVLPKLTYSKKLIRIWSAGCSTGEEAYSLAMLFTEYITKNKIDCEIKIFATDIDRDAIEFAGQGLYPESIVADVEPVLLTKYFTRKENGYQVNEIIRKKVIFATHNLLKDPPFSKLDLIVCRNLFIYLKPEMQKRLLAMFYYSLNPDGFLVMGSSESIGEMIDAFEVVDSKWKIYKYKEGYKSPLIRDLPLPRNQVYEVSGYNNLVSSNKFKMDKLMESAISAVLPPSIIVDDEDNIIHVVNDVSKFFKIKPGRFSQNLYANLNDDLSIVVSNLLRRLKTTSNQVVFERYGSSNGIDKFKVIVEGRAIYLDKKPFYLLSFTSEEIILTQEKEKEKEKNIKTLDIDSDTQSRIEELERELQITKESLQATVEELETSNEELQSSNEELIASNEELQSTNEELQSVNEELYTVNSEHQSKIEELTRLNNDLDNLLKNTEVGALYLDRNLCIRKITPLVSKITNILPSDIGRPISHISVMNQYGDLLNDIYSVVEDLKSVDKEIHDGKGNVWLARIRPYRTEYNSVEGVMITFFDISKLKQEQARFLEVTERLNLALKIGNMAWWEWKLETDTITYDEKMATMLGYTKEEFPDTFTGIKDLIHEDDLQHTIEIVDEFLQDKNSCLDVTYRIKRKDGSFAWYYNRGEVNQRNAKGKAKQVTGIVIDISKIKELEWELKQSCDLLEKVLEYSPSIKIMTNAQGYITYANKKAQEIFEENSQEIVGKLAFPEELAVNPEQENPFAILKRTLQPLESYGYPMKTPKNKKLLLMVNAVPMLGYNGDFDGGVFTIHIEKGGYHEDHGR